MNTIDKIINDLNYYIKLNEKEVKESENNTTKLMGKMFTQGLKRALDIVNNAKAQERKQ